MTRLQTPFKSARVFRPRPLAAALGRAWPRRCVGVAEVVGLAGLLMVVGSVQAQQPSGANVVAGQVTVTQSATQTTVNQASSKAIVDWNSFSVGAGYSVNFVQSGSNAVILNRVVGGDPSTILGNISANGQVFLVNPNGVFFGAGARLDTAG
ncbi:MAG TPA: filamentous hemagglutinin N-terminal domain-containing protein, partial [Rhodocyclaceae bacterium]|nr:filamentous hemagglutinin N-terminal domain-containing protein [Rhodocyclaceae bacterium]